MHLRTILFLAAVVAHTYGLRCWTCYNSKGTTDCMRRGYLKECQENEQMCFSELRNVEGFWQITKRCKQPEACYNNHIQNPRNASIESQCNPYKHSSVCRCCCGTDACNRKGLFCLYDTPECPHIPRPVHGYTKCSFKKSATEVGSVCTFSCLNGYDLVGFESTTCIEHGYEPKFDNPTPFCQPAQCAPSIVNIANGHGSCSKGQEVGSLCQYVCDPGYTLTGPSSVICGSERKWSADPPTCEPKMCDAQTAPTNGNIDCDNDVLLYGTKCSFTCDDGYSLVGTENNMCIVEVGDFLGWNEAPPTCEPSFCLPVMEDIENGEVSCDEGNSVGSICTFTCDAGFALVPHSTVICQSSGEWSDVPPACEPMSCSVQTAPSNGGVSCSNENMYLETFCAFSCDSGFFLNGAEENFCEVDRSGIKLDWSEPIPVCEPIICIPDHEAPMNGTVDCDTNTLGTVCNFKCDEGFMMFGSNISVCVEDVGPLGKWTELAPICEPRMADQVYCPHLPASINHGDMLCSNNNTMGSECLFMCDAGFDHSGEDVIECLEDGDWSGPVPKCLELACDTIDGINNGTMSCSDGNNVDSTCWFMCNIQSGLLLHPETATTNQCLHQDDGTAAWFPSPPCCTLPCPPYILMDIVIVLDSSSSVGIENWRIQREFTSALIQKFKLGPNSARMSILRYNSHVDEDSEIKLNDVLDGDMDKVVEKFEKIPYNGRGTMTGKALQHVQAKSLSSAYGNRSGVKDVVIVITDGRAEDPRTVVQTAKEMRESGVMIFAVGIAVNDIVYYKLTKMTGSEERTIKAEDFDDLLAGGLVEQLGGSLCRDPCDLL